MPRPPGTVLTIHWINFMDYFFVKDSGQLITRVPEALDAHIDQTGVSAGELEFLDRAYAAHVDPGP